MKILLGFEDTPLKSKQRFDAARKLASSSPTDLKMQAIPLEELSNTIEHVDIEIKEACTNTELDMHEFVGIDKSIQRIQG